MSTKANIHFVQGEQRVASLYQHHDGDPASMSGRFASFFESIEHVTDDYRYDDPRYLAAKFVIWHALTAARRSSADPLATLGICIDSLQTAPADYDYFVLCTRGGIGASIGEAGRPSVRFQALDDGLGRPRDEPLPIGL